MPCQEENTKKYRGDCVAAWMQHSPKQGMATQVGSHISLQGDYRTLISSDFMNIERHTNVSVREYPSLLTGL